METSGGLSLRVLTRPSSSSTPVDSSPSIPSTPPQSSFSSLQSPPPVNGVVVVGVVGRSQDDVTHLLNRLLDAHIFGSGNRDRDLFDLDQEAAPEEDEDENEKENGIKDKKFRFKASARRIRAAWSNKKRISYYLDEEKGVVYVQYAWGTPHLDLLMEDFSSQDYPSILDRHEADDLCGLLVMFSVCHIIVFIHEGVHFDTQILKTFRTLQAAKHALAPFVKIHVLPGLLPPPSSARTPTSRTISTSTSNSPGRGGIIGRHTSTISLMSGSSPTLLPGQCTPVMLFVFLDDFLDGSASGSHGTSHQEDTLEATTLGHSQGTSGLQSSGIVHIPRSNLQSKTSNPVVMLARTTNKLEGGFRKKLQSSLEAQIRFLIKKCRTIAGGGDGGPTTGSGMGPRGPGSVSSISGAGIGGTLFALDASRAVALLDRSANQKGEPLDAATRILEEILNGKEASENLLLENHSNGGISEDVQSIKDFLYRQAELLRGRGGIASNSAGGSLGVGMVAAAAAAAAASAAAGGSGGSVKPLSSPPELPSLANWLLACLLLFEALFDCKSRDILDKGATPRCLEKSTSFQKKEFQETASMGKVGSQTGQSTLETVIACLESGKGLDMKFSATWCKRALPAAKEVYMKGLPPCYPTAVHKAHLEKALNAFQMMVRGPAVHYFPQKLKEDCEAIWKCGRQLCDAVSLTGKPCVHQKHDVTETCSSSSELESEKSPVNSHSSGFVFLHACTCGRSRRLRDDPFDFESANVTFFHFPNCEDLLPSFAIPNCESGNPVGGSAWSLVRLGGEKYYDISAGLLQSGFCTNENFLFAWKIPFMQDTVESVAKEIQQKDCVHSNPVIQDLKVQTVNVEEQKKISSITADATPEIRTASKGQQRKFGEKILGEDLKLNSGRGFPVTEMKKAFAEVVAKSNYSTDSAFPPLQLKRQTPAGPEKSVKQKGAKERKEQVIHGVNGDLESMVLKSDMASEKNLKIADSGDQREDTSVLFVGDNVVPTPMNKIERPQLSIRKKYVVVYVGFEHECPHGHRFLLSLDHLEKLGSPYTDSMSSTGPKKVTDQHTLKQTKQVHKHLRTPDTQNVTESLRKQVTGTREMMIFSHQGQSASPPNFANTELKCEGDLLCTVLNEGEGPGFSLLNMNLPIYMNCPHCKTSSRSKKQQSLKFASTISQLQRIFLVTPPFPTTLATCPAIQFEESCVPDSIKPSQQYLNFSFGSRVVLPPESFLTLKLPFVYGAWRNDGSAIPFLPRAHRPELTAWLVKGTTLQILLKEQDNESVFSL
ncbi:hypothetical protein SUGI_0035580 [Cryptomeria japonica]|uniref:uncharacterized protein LOC131075755 n=1 Tax=Cryptomeria japonica TaxID=3369 RepID=UPI0024089747|nr:uncharacterized protein LOC131075755 [Cryptomeria japonica]XP_057868623.2 uncharacterized protein LOC131075755 [Cryptomeria japonica]XP_057868624.2 uncharacterized protein LOC131075755 [Cryptomeria japonica]XP_057868626.2 uncharacterized protein LOC131075755 [Cryptomeria japonica]XP_057868628.2 uncharacterized protein LOC131075755 [Cryptomeria japonica]XP_059073088.1 uncharacterized protein LOC131075755 [Cryptomeria japonica]GLJ06291.1 hypothetical protein SUGI_0035580 [Cryptomeria japonic